MKEYIFRISPNFIQNFFIYLYNKKAYKIRYGGLYWKFRNEIKENRNLTLEELQLYQKERYKFFIDFILKNSNYYKDLLSEIPNNNKIENIKKIPILTKETLRSQIDNII